MKINRHIFSGKLGVIWMLSSFKKCDPEGHQKNFSIQEWIYRQGRWWTRSLWPQLTLCRAAIACNRKETSLLCFSSLTVQLPPSKVAECSWKSGSVLGVLKGLELLLKMGHCLGVVCTGNLEFWAAFVNIALNIDVEVGVFFYKVKLIVFLYIMSFGPVFSRHGIYELFISNLL